MVYDKSFDDSRPVSTTPSDTGKGKKKKSIPPISIEEVFNSVSTVTASNINPPPSKILLTPRSAEVCLKLGLNPEVLKIRDIDSFWENGIDPAVQRMRHEAYVQRRHDLMKQCRSERRKIMNAEFEAATNINASSVLTPEMLLEQQKEQSATLIQQELQRIEKMQKKQEKELEQMIQYEITRAKIQQDMNDRLEKEKKKEEIRKKQQEKRIRLMEEERRLRELQRAAMEEAEEATRREVARQMHEKEYQLKVEREKKLEEAKKLAREQEIEKRAKNEEHRIQVQRFFEEEQQKLRERLATLHEAEEKKQQAILQRQKEQAESLRRKREIIEQRLEQNMKYARQIEEKRKEDFNQKQDHFEETRRQHLMRQEQERQLHIQELELQEQRRRFVLEQQRREELKRAEQLLTKFDQEEAHVEMVQERKEREFHLWKEKKTLKSQMKSENVDRVMRMSEFKRMSTLKRIEDQNSRVEKMKSQKQQLLEDRRKAARDTKLQKETLSQMMNEVRTNAQKAHQLISSVLSGKVSVADIAKGMSSTTGSMRKDDSRRSSPVKGGLARASSASDFGINDSTDEVMRSSSSTSKVRVQKSELVGLGRTASSNGGDDKNNSKYPDGHYGEDQPSYELGDYDQVRNHQYYEGVGNNNNNSNQPYKSPYELPLIS